MVQVSCNDWDMHLWSRHPSSVSRCVVADCELEDIRRERSLALEAAIGSTAEFLPYAFLVLGARRGRAVARCEVRTKTSEGLRTLGTGTGFMIAPGLLMTNHHVFPNVETARHSRVQFNYEIDTLGGETDPDNWSLDPDRLFITSPFEALDFTIVAVTPRGSEEAGAIYGTIPLRADRAKIAVGERVHIIQHPAGRRKEVVLHENQVTSFLEGGFLHYSADTLVGSSGAPVFNDQWDLVALHHRGVIRHDAEGNPVLERASYVCDANEGIRISAIVQHLASPAVSEEQRARLQPFLQP